MHFPSQSSFVFLFFITLTQFSFACENWSDHATDVIKLLNVSLTSEATNDSGKTPSTNGLAYITVNGKNYAPQTKGFNVAVFDHLSGRFLTSAAFDCAASQAKCNELGTFLSGLPQDTVVLIAIQKSGLVRVQDLPTNQLEEVGIQSSSSLGANSSFTSIGYKGKNAVDWKKEAHNNDSAGPTTIAALIPINCSYVPSASTTCSPFNVASQKYGGSCMNSSSGDCRYATDGNSTTGWESSSSRVINSYLKIGFHTSFTVNKLRIQQNVTTGQQIQEILLEFSDCSHEKFTLKANSSDFEELSFLSRPAKWIKFTVKKLYGASGGVGIQEIEVYNEYCNQKSLCDAVLLNSNNQSSHYRLHSRKFQFMIDAQRKVTVLLTSGSLVTSSRYEIIIGSAEDNQLKLKRIKGNITADLLEKNVTGPLKENEMRSFWIEVETDRVVLGSGEVLYLFWRDSDPINVKYVFFSTTTSTAIIHVCGRTDQCYTDATHYWPLDKPVFVKDINNGKIGKIHGPWITERAAAKADFSPLALSIDSSASWVDLSDLSDSCLSIPSKCPNGFSLSFKASISGTGTGYLLSLGTVSIFYVDETMYFTVKDTHKEWEVKGAFKRNTWQTFSIGWSYANGLTAVIVGNAATVLYDFSGKTVTPSAVTNGSFTIGRPKYFSGAIRDVAIWELEISEERMKTLHVCNDPDSCPVGWEYFDGSCYKVSPSNLSASAAREACVNETADLVKITSEEENAFVRSLLKGDAWIGLKRKPNDVLYYWRDGMNVSYEKWSNGSSSGDCVVMESSGNWSKTSCSSYTSRYVCEQVPYQYLGCYKDGDTSPAFVFNPGGYKPSSMTPGLCMYECGTWYYNYAAVKGGMLCLCSNSTSPAAEGAADMCFWPCFGSGNLKCGGKSHISVFKSVTVWPRRLNMSLDSSVYTFKAFNITLTPTLPANETVESYTINIGDGTTHYTTHSPATIAILHPGSYYIKGTAIVKHSKTGYRSTIESPVKIRRVVSELTGLNISCQSCAPVNVSAGCSVIFRYGSNVDYTVQFGDGKGPVNGSLPDAAVLTVGTPAGEAHSPITSDGLYLMAGTEVKSKGEAVALEMDVETGGSLEIMVYRPTCTDSTQRYCTSTKTCISDITMCTGSEKKTCDNDAIFSFSDGLCVVQSMSRCKNETLPYGNFNYQQIHKYLVYTTSGPKRILIEDENQRFQLQPGDVFGVRFASSAPTGALKTSSSGSSLFYSSAVINKTGSGILRGNYHPFTEDSPQNRSILPAIALVVSTVSESRIQRVYEKVGHKTIALSVGNSVTRENVTKSICLQEMVTELQLNIPEVFPSAESVNLTGSITKGTNVTFIWDFGDNSNHTTKLPWVTKIFDNTGERTLGVLAGNKIGVAALWCQVVIQERIAGLKFKNDSLKTIENGTTASIGWTLFNGSHVEFNVTITLPDGSMETRNLTDVKVPGARFFGLYKSNFTIVGWYSVVITATNRVNNETIAGNLSVQYAIHGVAVEHRLILKTNETFNFTVLPHLGDEMARYTLHTMDGKTTNSTDKVMPYTYTTAGRYKVVLIASNDVSSMLVNCTEIIVQDVIEGFKYTSANHSVAVNAPAEIHWRLTQGSELLFSIDYGDGSQKIVNRSLSVGDIFVAISTHNYTKPGEYHVVINASNLVDRKTINTTVYVETPAEGPGLAIWRTTYSKAQEKLCKKELYIEANDSVTMNVTISNGTNLNVAINFGDNSSDESRYFPLQFPTSGWSTNHSYSIAGKYNITVTFFNRNPSNVSYTCLLIVQYGVKKVKVTSDSPRNSSDAAVTLNVSFPGPEFEPSGPLNYYWRYGDNNFSLTNNSMTVYNYPNKCGVYIVTVNVSNEISSGIGSVEVIIQDAIQGLKIITKHTEYENQSCSDFTLRNDTYPVEYDVSFKAFITNGTNVTFTWNFDSDGAKNYSNETVLHTFSPCKELRTDCEHTIRLKAQNKVSNMTRDVTITLMESILNVTLTDDGPTVQGKAVNFTLTVGERGHDPRFLLDLDVDEDKTYPKQYKKSDWVKLKDLSCTSLINDRRNKNCTQYFDVTYEEARAYTVNFRAKNAVSCIKLKPITVLVGRGHCELPVIKVPGFESGEKKQFKRSEKISIETDNKIICFNHSTEFRWKITKKCGSDQQDSKPDERTTALAALYFNPRYFYYCKEIEFIFSINMTWVEGFYSEKKFSIEITETLLLANILGGSKRTVGNNATVQIDASKSEDPDEPGSKFEFAWFCNVSGGKLPENISSIETNNPLSNGSCFGYAPGQLTDFNKTKITLNTGMAIAGKTYTIRFVMAKRGRTSVFKDQDIKIVEGDPPEISIECVKNCKEKLNPSEKFSLKGKGKSKVNQKIIYLWSVQICETFSDPSDCSKEKNLQRYSAVPDLTSETLVIKPGYFNGTMKYQVTLSGHFERSTAEGTSTFNVEVNKPPIKGRCEVSPKKGEPLKPVFKIECKNFKDPDGPAESLSYKFFYKQSKEGPLTPLGQGSSSDLNDFALPSGNLTFTVKVTDKFGASVHYDIPESVEVNKKELNAEQLTKILDSSLDEITASGNLNQKLSFLSSVAQAFVQQKESKEDPKASKEFVDKLVSVALDNTDIEKDMKLGDLTQLSGTLSKATSVAEQNSNTVINKVTSFIKSAAELILNQTKEASSKDIEEASEELFGTAVNVIKTDSSKSKQDSSDSNNTQEAVGTVKKIGAAILTTKIDGEKETTIKKESFALAVERYKADDMSNKTINLDGSEVILPANFKACLNKSSVNRMSLVSDQNLFSGGKGAGQVTDKVVSLSFTGSKDDGSVDVDGKECTVEGLEEAISVSLPRNNTFKNPPEQEGKLHSAKYSIHEFNITENASAVTVQVAWNISVAVQIYIKKGSRPRPEESVYDFNATFRLGGRYSDDSTNFSLCKLFLSNDDLNWTAAGQYFVMLGYTKNDSLPLEELDKIGSDGTVPYNFSMYTSKCMFYDEKKNLWSTDGLKVGPKTNLKSTECLTTHLTTFGCSFFVPPNKINFDKLSVQQLLDSPHALIFVCVILGLYLICLIPARRADKRDALQTGVTPLPDNDSRDTYCYEIHVHTGFIRGAGTSAEVSIVLTGGLEETEPRVLKDPNRKNFKTGSVDPFLLTVPQSLGSIKQIRIWHNNGGNYPSWNLLRVMIQDLQTDQRWWFVCDDWLAVDEGDGKIERILYPASKKDLTKFNVLFTSEVRKNLTDGHIWFSVVARPPRSNFTRVQRLTCCLSILMTTLIANAMFYQLGENETPKNAIRIMGFSFSIRQVSIGFMSSMIVFPANLIIVTIFRKAKPKASQYEVKSGRIEGEDVDIETGEEKKKSPKKFALPHWFVYVAYVMAFIATCTSASFVIMYGMEFGPEKSARWLSSITISFLQDVLFTQPIKVFIMATLFALLIKDPKKAEQESFADANTLANDEEWLQKNTEDLDPETQQTLKQLINDKPPDEAKLEIARKLRMKERQMESIIREIAWYVIFLLVLLTIAYGNRDLTTSKVTRYMKDTFEDSVHGENVTYGKVHEISHYWTWIRTIFIPSLMPRYYYDDESDYDRRFLADTPTAFLLGVARLRQLRIKKDTCVFKRYFLYFIHECNDFYSVDEEDRGSYLPGWKVKPTTSNQSLLANSKPDPWMYQTGSQLNTYPYWGYKATYSAGGFVQELPNNESEALNAIQNLSDTNWLDRYTRAIFSEFAIYNANTNLFSVVTLLFEQLPTGSLTPYPSILTLRLFRYVGGEMYFVLTCEIVYLLFCIYFVLKEIKQFVKKGKEHLKNPWSVLEIFLTCLSLTAVGLYFARLAFTKRALKAMNNNLGTSFVSFHYTAFLDEWFKCIIGIIVFLSILKVFRLLRFNRRMSMLQQVLKRCFTQLISFMIMFALAFLAFALLACLVFGQIMEGFGTFLDSCASLMDTLLGKFALKEMSQANRIIGPIFFYSYTVSMVFILINMFVTIINDTFTEVRSDVEKQSNDYEIVDFMIHRLKKNIGKTIGHAIHPVYKEPKSDLELKFDKIVDDADNVMHFMRNMTFEDFRKTRWFQNETCTEKKKNLIRLLMEVDWDYYEDELCDSIPVFERFLSERSEEELEAMLQAYRQKRMVEDLVFDKINGEDSSSQSDSDSDDSSDGLDNTSDDEQSSNDENRSETEPNVESDRRPSTSTYSTSSTSSAKVPGTAARVLTPALIITDVRPETVVELEQHVEENMRKSSFADQGVSDNELLAILEDVQRDVESRCATDAELDSILYEDTFTPRRCDSNPETSFADKKTKKRKKTAELPVEEKTIKEAWVTVSLTAKEPDDVYENTTEGMDGEENAKAQNKMGMETASEVEERQNKRLKKKGKQVREDHISAVEDGERKPNKTGKKKKKGQDGVDVGAEDNLQGETRDGEGTKRKKKSAASLNLEVIGESDKKETSGREVAKKEKKKKTIADKAKEEDDGENGSEEQVERESRKESIEISAAEEERAKEGERRKKRKKKKEAMEEKGEEKTKGDVDEETETKKNSNEFSEMFEEVLGSSCDDQTSLKKIKKKGKAKKKLVVEEDDRSGLFKSGETSYGSGEQQKEIKFSMEESSVERKESADQTGLKKMRKKGKAKKKFVLEEEDRSSLFKSGETSYGSGEEQKERKFSLEESSIERKESVA